MSSGKTQVPERVARIATASATWRGIFWPGCGVKDAAIWRMRETAIWANRVRSGLAMVTGPTGGSVEGVPWPYQQGRIPHPTMYIAIRRVVWKLCLSISKSASKMYISKNGRFKVKFSFEVCKSTWVLSTSHTNQVGFVYIRGLLGHCRVGSGWFVGTSGPSEITQARDNLTGSPKILISDSSLNKRGLTWQEVQKEQDGNFPVR